MIIREGLLNSGRGRINYEVHEGNHRFHRLARIRSEEVSHEEKEPQRATEKRGKAEKRFTTKARRRSHREHRGHRDDH